MDVFGLDGDSLGVDGGQVGVFKEPDQIGFASFLESTDSRRLEPQISLEILCNLTNQTLEGELADKQFGGFLVATDFTQRNSAGSVSVGLLDTAGDGSRLAGGFGSELLAGGFSSSGFAGSLLGSGHLGSAPSSRPFYTPRSIIQPISGRDFSPQVDF